MTIVEEETDVEDPEWIMFFLIIKNAKYITERR